MAKQSGAQRRQAELVRLKMLPEVPALDAIVDGHSLRKILDTPDHGPFMITEAQVVLDLLLDGWYEREAKWQPLKELQGAAEPGVAVIERFAKYSYMATCKRALFEHAVAIAKLEKYGIISRRKAVRSWLGAGLLYTKQWEGYLVLEHQYNCLFCDADLGTLGNDGRKIASAFMTKLNNHTAECAMRMLMKVAQAAQEIRENFNPQMHDQEMP